ncbi:MAG: type II toxin-antitoxin system VapC family toxin [Acidobacteria bacterium]|nr:type II toxin-antitoxin system VapC family toxin [Acidobacteriota bacterium]
MSLAVVDASAMAAVVFKEAEGQAVVGRLKGAFLVAPRLMAYELTNVAWSKILQRPDQRTFITQALERVLADDFAITWSDVEFEEVLTLAVQTKLTAYDASYLWLAQHMKAELVTLDRELAEAARRATQVDP